MKVTFWGTRGSIPSPGAGTVRYGGNTSCVQVVTDAGTLIVLDCGTGARLLGDSLMSVLPSGIRGHIFLTHTHWDHIQGFPFFAPIFAPSNEWRIYGPADGEHLLEQALSGQMQYTYFPVELDQAGASITFVNLDEGEFQVEDVTVRAQYLNHPAITLGYRLEVGGASLVYCTDHEPYAPTLYRQDAEEPSLHAIVHAGDRHHAEFVAGADVLIHDAQYTEGEYARKHNWGHSAIDYVIEIGLLGGVKRLVLFHHDPAHVDDMLDELQDYARSRVKERGVPMEVIFAREGETLMLEEGQASSRPSTELRAPPPGTRPTVLVTDDDPMIRELVRDILEDTYAIESAGTGEEVLTRVAAQAPDLLLLDMRLPDVDGFQVLQRLRDTEHGRELPIIMLTALAEAEYVERGFQLGATDYMTKPFSPPQLRARVSGWLRRSAGDALAP